MRLGDIRDFRVLWISGLLAGLGAQMSAIALPLLVLRQTGSAVQAGVVGSVSVGALLFTMLPGGALADTVERRRLMRVCDAGSTLVVGGLAVCVLAGRPPLALILLAAAVGAAINGVYGPAALGLLRAVVPGELLGAASSRMQARGAAARLVGPMAGGMLYAVHPALPFVGETVCLLSSTTCLAFVRTRSAPEPGARSAFSRAEFAAGLSFLWGRPYLRTVLLVFGLGMNAAFSALMFVALTRGRCPGAHDGAQASPTTVRMVGRSGRPAVEVAAPSIGSATGPGSVTVIRRATSTGPGPTAVRGAGPGPEWLLGVVVRRSRCGLPPRLGGPLGGRRRHGVHARVSAACRRRGRGV
ncbi:MFS transporter [Streptacidiphilus albus]|uniref:MFS transporter n=1 Tax=Streptacidiphilus albus TaxID=105425 RepID=UPI0009DD8997|nr:MFS transporter [Streptacidiphilus albus]